MDLDGPNIISVKEVVRQTEPIRGLIWDEKAKKLTSIDQSIEIVETRFIESSEVKLQEETDDLSPSTVVFAPGESYEELQPEEKEKLFEDDEKLTVQDTESLIKIKDYLFTISEQISNLIQPKLQEIGIDSESLQIALQKIEKQVLLKIENIQKGREKTSEQDTERNSDWKKLDWGKRRH
jgi:hypothetical protein